MKIFFYLFRQTFVSYLAVASLLLLIILSGRFVGYLADAAVGRFAGDLVLSLILYKIPTFASLVLPIGLFVGILLSYGQLYVDSEMVVIKACGVSKGRLLSYVMGPAICVMLMVGSLTFWLAPLGNQLFMSAWNNTDNFSGVGVLLPGKFESLSGSGVIYMQGINADKTKMKDVFFVKADRENNLTVIRAKSGVIDASSYQRKQLVLEDGELFSLNPDEQSLHLAAFSQARHNIPPPKSTTIQADTVESAEALSTYQLMQTSTYAHTVELLWRLSLTLLVPLSSILALSMAETSNRKGRYAKLLPAILLFIAYLGGIIVCRNEAENGTFSPYFILFPHLVFLCLGLLIYYWFEIQVQVKNLFPSIRASMS